MSDTNNDSETIFYSCLYTRHKTQKRKKWHDGKAKINFNELSANIFSLDTGKHVCKVPAGFLFFVNNNFIDQNVETEHYLVDFSEAQPLKKTSQNFSSKTEATSSTNIQYNMHKNIFRKRRKRFTSCLEQRIPITSSFVQVNKSAIHDQKQSKPLNSSVFKTGSFTTLEIPTGGAYNGNDILSVSSSSRSGNDIVKAILCAKIVNPLFKQEVTADSANRLVNRKHKSNLNKTSSLLKHMSTKLGVSKSGSIECVTDKKQDLDIKFPNSTIVCERFWNNVSMVQVPREFNNKSSSSLGVYSTCFQACLCQQMQIALWELAKKFHKSYDAWQRRQNNATPIKTTLNFQNFLYQRQYMQYHLKCEFFCGRSASNIQGSRKRRHGSLNNFQSEENLNFHDQEPNYFLKFTGNFNKNSGKYGAGDLWILNPIGKEPVIVAALWHSISTQSGMLRVKIISGSKSQRRLLCARKSTIVTALHGPSMTLELDMLSEYQKLSSKTNTRQHILSSIIDGPQPMTTSLIPRSLANNVQTLIFFIKKHVDMTCTKYNLNTQQRECLFHTANWFLSEKHQFSQVKSQASTESLQYSISRETRAVELIHGVFGAGKSFLVSVLLEFIASIVQKQNFRIKVLIAGGTNNAVDGILRYLLFTYMSAEV